MKTTIPATFIGRTTGLIITVEKFGENDFSVWFRDSAESSETEGYSIRGTAQDVFEEIKEEIF